MILKFNAPQDPCDVVQILFHALHLAFQGSDHSVSAAGNAVDIQWSDETGDGVDDGSVVYMTNRQYRVFRDALKAGKLAGWDGDPDEDNDDDVEEETDPEPRFPITMNLN